MLSVAKHSIIGNRKQNSQSLKTPQKPLKKMFKIINYSNGFCGISRKFNSLVTYQQYGINNGSDTLFRLSRSNTRLALRVNQNRNSIQEMFGTLRLEIPSVVPLINIASQLYSGVSAICEAFLSVRDRNMIQFHEICKAGNITPSFTITYNSLLVFIQGCYAPIYHYGGVKDRLYMVGGVPIELLIIATYSFAAFWTIQHIFAFTMKSSTSSLIKYIEGNNIPLIRLHEIFYKLIFAKFDNGKMGSSKRNEMGDILYDLKPSITFEKWHNTYEEVNDIVKAVLDLVELIDNKLNRTTASCIVRSLIDGKPDDYASTGMTGASIVNLQRFMNILNLRNGAGSIEKVMTNGIISDINSLPITYIMEGFHTILSMSHIPFRFAKDVHSENLTLSEFTYAFPIVCDNPKIEPSKMKLFISKAMKIRISKFIAYGWTAILGSHVSINSKVLKQNKLFEKRFLNSLVRIDSKFISPYAGLFRDAFIMMTGVVSQRLNTRVDGITVEVNTCQPTTNVKYIAEMTTGFTTIQVEKSIMSNGSNRNIIMAKSDLFAGAIPVDDMEGGRPLRSSGSGGGKPKAGGPANTENRSNARSTQSGSNNSLPIVQTNVRRENESSVIESRSEGIQTEESRTGKMVESKGLKGWDSGSMKSGMSQNWDDYEGMLGSDDGAPNVLPLDAISNKRNTSSTLVASLRNSKGVSKFIGTTLNNSKMLLSVRFKKDRVIRRNNEKSSITSYSDNNNYKVKIIGLIISGSFIIDINYKFNILISDSIRRNSYSNLISKIIRECVVAPLHNQSFKDKFNSFYRGFGSCSGKLLGVGSENKLFDIDFIRNNIPKEIGYKSISIDRNGNTIVEKKDYIGLTYLIVNGVRFRVELDVNRNIKTFSVRQNKKLIKEILVLINTRREELDDKAKLQCLSRQKGEVYGTFIWEMFDGSLVSLKIRNYSLVEREVQNSLIEKIFNYDIEIVIDDTTPDYILE